MCVQAHSHSFHPHFYGVYTHVIKMYRFACSRYSNFISLYKYSTYLSTYVDYTSSSRRKYCFTLFHLIDFFVNIGYNIIICVYRYKSDGAQFREIILYRGAALPPISNKVYIQYVAQYSYFQWTIGEQCTRAYRNKAEGSMYVYTMRENMFKIRDIWISNSHLKSLNIFLCSNMAKGKNMPKIDDDGNDDAPTAYPSTY